MIARRPWLALALLLAGCGKEVPTGGVRSPSSVAAPTDLIPEDLDLVVRVDLARMRSSLGDETTAELLRRAFDEGASALATPQPLLKEALSDAAVVWLATRVADADAGDRVVVIRPRAHARRDEEPAEDDGPRPGGIDWRHVSSDWERKDTEVKGVTELRAGLPPRRDGTERIYLVGGEPTAVFVSPVESLSVERVLERGPDPRRGQPEARGIVSLDYRAGRLGDLWSTRFPSLAALWRGVERVVALLDVRADSLELDARIHCKRPGDAARLLRFLETIRQASLQAGRHRSLLEPLEIGQNEHTITLSWSLPAAVIAATLAARKGEDAAAEDAPPAE